MSNTKNVCDEVECYYCGQLSFVDDLQKISIQDGPDDCIDVEMCSQCAEGCAQDAPSDEDWKEFNER